MTDGQTADVNESEWQYLLEHARNAAWPAYQALVEAAYSKPALRRLYPTMEYWILFFAESSREVIVAPKKFCLEASSDPNVWQFTLRRSWQSPPLAQVATPAEAVALAVQRLREDPGEGY